MRPASLPLLAVACFLFADVSLGQINERTLCDPAERNDCIPATLEVVFPAVNRSVFDTPFPSPTIDTQVVIDHDFGRIQGWSYGVAHDHEFLTLLEDTVTTDGTIVDPDHPHSVMLVGFSFTDAFCGGYVSAIVLSFLNDSILPAGRHVICTASYDLAGAPGSQGTLVRFADEELWCAGDPSFAINITNDGVARLPTTVIEGLVRTVAEKPCDDGIDNDGDGLVDCDDAECCDEPFCAGAVGCHGEVCCNSVDDDDDGLIDLADPDCSAAPECPEFQRGDADGSGTINVADALFILRTILGNFTARYDCDDSLDADDDGVLSISDAIPVLRFLFLRGEPLPSPFSACGLDATPDDLSCSEGSPACPGM